MSVSTAMALTAPDQVRQDVDQFLEAFFGKQVQRANLAHSRYGLFWETIRDIYRAGGKRYRPYLTVLAYQIFGGSDYHKILPLAAATEVLHMALLAMDDVIDRDYMRHGKPNVAGTYLDIYAPVLADKQERTHFADSAAILAESLLLIASQQLIATAPLNERERQQALQIFDDSTFIEGGGELLDVEAGFVAPADRADWEAIARYKTADYSFIAPMLLGATLADASEAARRTIRTLGNALGIAYQLADDMLLFSDEVETGKPKFSDLEEGKMTYLMTQALAKADASDRRWLESLLGTKPISDADGARVRQIMETTGARVDAERLIAQYVADAKREVAQLEFPDEAHQALMALINKAAWRTK